VYTVIAIVNAVVIGASARRAEFATARLTGLTRGQVVRMALWEAIATLVIGVLLGGLAATGTMLGVAIGSAKLLGFVVVGIPWTLLGILVLGALVIVAGTSVLTTLSATST